MPTSANTSRTGRSVLEAPVGQPIVHFEDLRLTPRLLASKGKEADLVPIQIDLTTNQAVGPDLAQRPGLAQQDDLAVGVASPQVDQPTTGPLLQVQLPVGREGATARGRLDPRRPLLAQGGDVSQGVPPQVLQVFVLEPRPHLGLPP